MVRLVPSSVLCRLFSCSAPGLINALFPILLLSTSYCGSSLLALTLRPPASVSDVISRLTVPSTSWPWLFQVTWSPLLISSDTGPPGVLGVVPCPCPRRHRGTHHPSE